VTVCAGKRPKRTGSRMAHPARRVQTKSASYRNFDTYAFTDLIDIEHLARGRLWPKTRPINPILMPAGKGKARKLLMEKQT